MQESAVLLQIIFKIHLFSDFLTRFFSFPWKSVLKFNFLIQKFNPILENLTPNLQGNLRKILAPLKLTYTYTSNGPKTPYIYILLLLKLRLKS